MKPGAMPGAGVWRLALVLCLSAGWLPLVLFSSVPALAHANLQGSSPPAGGELSAAPEQVRLRFNEPVEAEFSPIEVRDQDGARVDEDDARVDPQDTRVVIVDLEELPEGSYRVEWRVTSLDGHVVEGWYGFAVTAGEDGGSGGGQGEEGDPGPQAGREPAARDGSGEGPTPILTYSALSGGTLAFVVAAAFLVNRLARRHRA